MCRDFRKTAGRLFRACLDDPAKVVRIFRYGLWSIARELGLDKIDSATCIYIDLELPVEELKERLDSLPRLNFIHVDHSKVAGGAKESIITLARRDAETKAKLVVLANAGFHLYIVRDGVSSMVHHRRISTLWKPAVAGDVKVDRNGIFYSLAKANGEGEPRLLVIFSSIAGDMYTPSLVRHFEKNYSTISKYVPQNTHVLRIVDFGGVVGSFYLNSKALPKNEEYVWECIQNCADELNVSNGNIVLYGTSKGGTAATLYSVRHGVRGVAVDPILSDEHYEKVHHDLHFTQGTFQEKKEDKFKNLLERELHHAANLSVICSTRSPQFVYIKSIMIDGYCDRFLFINTENREIRKHPDVAPKALAHTLSQINLQLAGIDVPGGFYTVW